MTSDSDSARATVPVAYLEVFKERERERERKKTDRETERRGQPHSSLSYNFFRVSFGGEDPGDSYGSRGGFLCSNSDGFATTFTSKKLPPESCKSPGRPL